VTASRGRESATFEYDDEWLINPERSALEPAVRVNEIERMSTASEHEGAAKAAAMAT
jgi:hypothetical protein